MKKILLLAVTSIFALNAYTSLLVAADITKKNKIGVKDKSGVFLGVCLTAARSFSMSSSSHTITTEI